ncbi:hypothetical protein [Burkholderia perseverans]|uniref:hypothetical protein n=1 Tax=Burkholderia perseverans TaxID=2615214 RepID=UPI001FEE3336|nr:hypothetical protein [Burkholderia perseverans]
MFRRTRHAAMQRHDALAIDAARLLNRATLLLSASVLADSSVEHYRGTFHNPAMLTPLAAAMLSIAASLHGHGDDTRARHRVRDAIHLGSAAAALAGLAFHAFNVVRRPGGLDWHNLFYGAPLGAPFALLLSGALGAAGERLRDGAASRPTLAGYPAGRALAALVAAGLAGTVGEVALLHFRGAFQHRAMVLPLVLPPVAAAAMARVACSPRAAPDPGGLGRAWLRATAALGLAGAAFHARGVARQMGGWRNWTQNLLSGPPLPAPPAFTALAMAGLAALELARHDAGPNPEDAR